MRISEIFLLENLSINVLHHRLTMTIVCLNFYSGNLSRFQYFDRKGNTHPVGKQTHDLTVIASDSKTTQSGGDNRKKFPLGAALQVPHKFSFAPL